jgi:integrase
MDLAKFTTIFCDKRNCRISSAKTTWYNIRRLLKLANKENKLVPKSTAWVKNSLLDEINKLKSKPRRNVLASLVSYLKVFNAGEQKIKTFVASMMESAKVVQSENKNQQMSDTQKKNWVKWGTILNLYKLLSKDATARNLWRKANLTTRDINQLNSVFALAFHGVLEPPMRLELATVKLGTRYSTGNFIYKNKGWILVLNDTKTSNKTGPSQRKLSGNMARLINKYIRVREIKSGEYLIQNKFGSNFSQQAYSRFIKRIFKTNLDRNIGASMLRSIYLSHKYKNTPNLLEMESTAIKMGHSVSTALEHYVKHNPGISKLN